MSQGFTLVELVVALAVAGILMAVAYPSFADYLLRSRRSDATQALAQVQLAQERWRGNNTSYAANLADLGLAATSTQGHYTLVIGSAAANSYSATATATSSQQAQDERCRSFTLLMAGGNITYGSANAAGTPDSAGTNRCWVR